MSTIPLSEYTVDLYLVLIREVPQQFVLHLLGREVTGNWIRVLGCMSTVSSAAMQASFLYSHQTDKWGSYLSLRQARKFYQPAKEKRGVTTIKI